MRGWEFQEPALAKHFELVLLDQRGHGLSSGPGVDFITAEIFSRDLKAFLDSLGYSKVHVVATSMGGIIAQQFTLDWPEMVEKLVLIDTGPKITEQLVDVVYGWREAQVEGGDEAYFWASTRSCYPPEFIESNKEIIDYLFGQENRVNPDGVVAAGLGLSTFDVVDRLASIRAPTLIVHGTLDGLFDVSLGRLMDDKIPDSRLEIFEGCGHCPQVQMKERLNKLVIDFLLE
jgi:3-oxoadipate enol-lactonase